MSAKRLALVQQGQAASDPLESTLGALAYRVYVTKRMVFVASLYFRMLDIQRPTPQELDRANIRFKLACRGGALKLPAAISVMLWRTIDLGDVYKRYLDDESSLPQLAKEILDGSPEWIKYGDGRRIQLDIKSVFDSLRV